MVLAALLACLAVQDSTQSTDATQFRRGQWALLFSAGLNFGSLGALKFRSPSRALVLDLRVSGAHAEQSYSDTAGTHFAGASSRATVTLRFGWRRYHHRNSKIAPHYSLGLLSGFSHQFTSTATSRSKDESWQAGAFTDVGATYLLTPQFGIGALLGANLTYEWGNARATAAPHRHYWTLSGAAGTPTLFVTLFF